MTSKAFLFAMIIVAVSAAIPALATDYMVGDASGWSLGVNYTAWAEGKEFYVADRLLFSYEVGTQNVYKVNGTAFQQCSVPPPSEAQTSGNDIITLGTPGRKWYISGVGNNCEYGVKLVITVWSPVSAPSPSPAYGAPMKKPPSIWSNWKLLKFHV